jgi:hypothetical protein
MNDLLFGTGKSVSGEEDDSSEYTTTDLSCVDNQQNNQKKSHKVNHRLRSIISSQK